MQSIEQQISSSGPRDACLGAKVCEVAHSHFALQEDKPAVVEGSEKDKKKKKKAKKSAPADIKNLAASVASKGKKAKKSSQQ